MRSLAPGGDREASSLPYTLRAPHELSETSEGRDSTGTRARCESRAAMALRTMIPELQVTELAASLDFYTRVLGFTVAYSRPEEHFAMLEREDAALMIEQAGGPGRRITTTPLERPFGRGINLQIMVSDVVALAAAVQSVGYPLYISLEERSYRAGRGSIVQRQFVVADPDGYLRFASTVA